MTVQRSTSRIAKIMADLGYPIPVDVSSPNKFAPAKRVGDLIFVSSVTPRMASGVEYVGRIGSSISLEQAKDAAKWCVANSLGCLRAVVELERVSCVVDVLVFCNARSGFGFQSEIADAASGVLELVFGEHGIHTRAAVGASSLVRNVPVVLKAIYSVDSTP